NGEDADGQMLTTNQGCWSVIVRIQSEFTESVSSRRRRDSLPSSDHDGPGLNRLDLSPRRLARCTRLGGGPAPDRQHLARSPFPGSGDLASPTSTNEMTHLLPVRLSLLWGGNGDEIFLGDGVRCNRFHARLHFIQDDILKLRFLRTNGRRLITLIGWLRASQC